MILYIKSVSHISIKNKNIAIKSSSEESIIPIDEVEVIVLENNYSTLSASLLSHLATNHIALFSVDEKFLPNGIFLPFHTFSRFSHIAKYQLSMKQSLKKTLWQNIVKNKVQNQINLLSGFGFDTTQIKPYTTKIVSNDSNNIEATVASIYWNTIFSNSLNYYTRKCDDIRNSTLNYGYAIIRGVIARAVSANGLLPFYGLHHSSGLNAFNLVDDLIEPFRVVVDKKVYELYEQNHIEDIMEYDKIEKLKDTLNLTVEIKRELLLLLDTKINLIETDTKEYTIISAIDRYVATLKEAILKNDSKKLAKVTL